jgi:two-component system OmpR family response regulator
MQTVLLIDDDVELSNMLGDFIGAEGFEVVVENNPEIGLMRATTNQFDIIVLDVMMPKINGLEVLRKVREQSKVPVIMLTAKGDDDSRILGLELGADDYVAKPCTPREIVARIRAILRRTGSTGKTDAEDRIEVGKLTLFPEKRQVKWDGKEVDLTSSEFNLLAVLAKKAGSVVKKEELSMQALGRPLTKYDRSIDVHMSSIRQKLTGGDEADNFIHTIYRLGYQMIKE